MEFEIVAPAVLGLAQPAFLPVSDSLFPAAAQFLDPGLALFICHEGPPCLRVEKQGPIMARLAGFEKMGLIDRLQSSGTFKFIDR